MTMAAVQRTQIPQGGSQGILAGLRVRRHPCHSDRTCGTGVVLMPLH
jgi:hypothetical protein